MKTHKVHSTSEVTGIGYMFRGFEYADNGSGKYIIRKDGEVVGKLQPSQDAARKFISEAIARRVMGVKTSGKQR